jgi:FkbM family methyltransferase
LDCGAYIGDSIIPICKTIPQKKIWYYAFEPSPDNLKELYENEQAKALGNNFKVYECGVGNENDMRFYEIDSDSDGGKFVKEAGLKTSSLEIRRLDDLDLEIHGKLYIKMDVEGSELDALKGSEDIIKKERPIMAICMYHRKNDLATIPLYIKSLVDNYNYYLRGGYHTILWAIPKEEGGKIK